jgi:hypothetical protein
MTWTETERLATARDALAKDAALALPTPGTPARVAAKVA